MGAAIRKEHEPSITKEGKVNIRKRILKKAEKFISNTTILLNKIKLTAVVGGNELVNPFVVTEVYIKQDDKWILGSIPFTKLNTLYIVCSTYVL